MVLVVVTLESELQERRWEKKTYKVCLGGLGELLFRRISQIRV